MAAETAQRFLDPEASSRELWKDTSHLSIPDNTISGLIFQSNINNDNKWRTVSLLSDPAIIYILSKLRAINTRRKKIIDIFILSIGLNDLEFILFFP